MSGPGAARRRRVLTWVDTMLGHVMNAIHGTYHAIGAKHLPRYLAEFSYRFNRRYDLAGMLARLVTAAHTTGARLSETSYTLVPVFADTNVVVCAFGRDDAEVARAEAILKGQPTVSVQAQTGLIDEWR